MNWQTQISAAETAVSQGNLPVAEYLYWEALKLAEAFGPSSSQVTDTAERLGDVLVRQSKFPEAEDLLLRLAQLLNSDTNVRTNKTPNTLLKLAEVYYAQGKYDRAAPFGMQALQGYEATYGSSHPETARVAGNVAYIFHAMRNMTEAERLYQRAIAVKSKAVKYDADGMNLMRSYASLLNEMHREDEAKHLMRCVEGLQSGNWEVYEAN